MTIYNSRKRIKYVSITDERIGGTLQGSLDEASLWLRDNNPNVIDATLVFNDEWDMWTVSIYYEDNNA